MTASIQTCSWSQLTDKQLLQACTLWNEVWPKDASPEARAERVRQAELHKLEDHNIHFIEEDGHIIATSRTFLQTIQVGNKKEKVLALASVCSNPNKRKLGLGKALVQHSFAHLNDDITICLFQTGVPEFYKKLGAKLINNQITTSAPDVRAFWEPYAMIYPALPEWDDRRPIDLLGPGW